MKLAIDMIGGKIPQSKYSHNAAMAYIYKHQLEQAFGTDVQLLQGEDWSNYDIIFIYHSMTFKGSLNLFGGASEENAKFFERLLTPNVTFYSLEIPMPDYGELCKSRKTCTDYWANIDWDKISEVCKNIEFMRFPEITTKLILGDSHSISAYLPKYMIIRKDARTLKGALRKTFRKEIEENEIDISSLTHLTLYFGNIDVRHHLCRESNPYQAVDELIKEYEQQILDLNIPNIEIIKLLPIEPESRKLPKTGYFDGTPFFGSREEREKVKDYFNTKLEKICEKNNFKFSGINDVFYNVDVVEYMDEYMEKPKSVHVAPLYYRTDIFNSSKKKSILKF